MYIFQLLKMEFMENLGLIKVLLLLLVSHATFWNGLEQSPKHRKIVAFI